MFRKKPPQLTIYDELQQTYNDCCNTSIKNLTLEEENNVEAALKGWKGLHTSLLYKIELFDKQLHKLGNDELAILYELKSIRDQNVKHLIRVQLRMDEVNRKKPVQSSNTTNKPASLSVLSLRSNASRSLTNSTVPRSMLKSLRPSANNSGSSSFVPKVSKNSPASQAATLAVNKKVSRKSDEPFQDFDQDTFDFGSNWERIDDDDRDNKRRPSNGNGHHISHPTKSDYSSLNLIDLEDEDVPKSRTFDPKNYVEDAESSDEDDDYLDDYFNSYHESDSKLQNLSLRKEKAKPPVPPPRIPKIQIQHEDKVGQNNSTGNLSQIDKPRLSDRASKSTSDIRENGVKIDKPKPKQPYVYTKPQPLNVSHLMKQLQKPKKTQPKVKAPVKPSQTKVSPNTHLQKVPSNSVPQKKSNITYNYVRAPGKGVSPTRKAAENKRNSTGNIESPTSSLTLASSDDPKPLTEAEEDELLISSIRGIDEQSARQILNDIVVKGDEVYWDDVVGLEGAKNSLKEAVVYPFLRPDLFKGLREPTRGMLLFGHPGTGKTMLARAVATESKSTFFSISSSSLTSKYLGESEKLVKAMFLLAKRLAPSIVFIDEIDSLLSSRTEGEVESSRRIKNEFLVQWSELSSAAAGREVDGEDVSRVLILGATNLPWSIDEAARRRFVRRQYIPLPEGETRKSQIMKLLKYQNHTLTEADQQELIDLTEGFSGSDITALAKDLAMGPLRSLGDALLSTPTEKIRPINLSDFKSSLKYIRPSVSREGLEEYEKWAIKFGSSGA